MRMGPPIGAVVIADSLGALPVLALIDSIGFGTLLVPVWLLMASRGLRTGRVLAFLGIVAGAHFAIGLAPMFGATALLDAPGHLLETDAFHYALLAAYAQLAVGIALLAISPLVTRVRSAERATSGGGLLQWRTRAMGDDTATGSAVALLGLALAAAVVEAASMLPYLAGMGIIAGQGPGRPGDGLLLLGYCLVMIVPALVLTIGRLVARPALEAPLARLDDCIARNGPAATAWAIGVIGFFLAAQAASSLWLFVPV